AISGTALTGGGQGEGFWIENDKPACLGPVAVYGTPGGLDYAYYYDYVNPSAQTYTLTSSTRAPNDLFVQRPGAALITYQNLAEVVFYTPHVGGSAVNVQSTPYLF